MMWPYKQMLYCSINLKKICVSLESSFDATSYYSGCLDLKSFWSPCSGQLTSSYYIDPASDKEFICSVEESSGMHKCSNLPRFMQGDVECTASISSGPKNETDCINWNQYYTDCKPGEMNPFHGAISFDNIGLAWVAIFLVSYSPKHI